MTLPSYGTAAVSFLGEEAGMDIRVGDWTPSLGDLKLTAHDIEIRVRGPYARREVLEIEAATFDLSLLWRFYHKKGVGLGHSTHGGNHFGHIEAGLERPQVAEGVYSRQLSCVAELSLNGVKYASSLDASSRRGQRLSTQLDAIQGDGPVTFDCSGDLASETYRPVQAVVTASTRQVMATAPREIQRLVVEDQQRHDEQVELPRALQQVERATRTIQELDNTIRRLPAPTRFPFNPFR